jgi:hypothetical protein
MGFVPGRLAPTGGQDGARARIAGSIALEIADEISGPRNYPGKFGGNLPGNSSQPAGLAPQAVQSLRPRGLHTDAPTSLRLSMLKRAPVPVKRETLSDSTASSASSCFAFPLMMSRAYSSVRSELRAPVRSEDATRRCDYPPYGLGRPAS